MIFIRPLARGVPRDRKAAMREVALPAEQKSFPVASACRPTASSAQDTRKGDRPGSHSGRSRAQTNNLLTKEGFHVKALTKTYTEKGPLPKKLNPASRRPSTWSRSSLT